MTFDANLWQAVADSLQGAPGPKGEPGATGNPGVKGDPGPAGSGSAVGTVQLDSFSGADADTKLNAAISHAAAQTYPPTIQIANRLYPFDTKGRKPYRGLAISGPPGERYDAADAGDTHGRKSEIALTFDSAADGVGWFHAADTQYQDRQVSFENLVIRDSSPADGSHPSFLTQTPTAKGYQLLRIHNLTTSGLYSTLGTLAQRLVIQGCLFDGAWHINNGWSQDVHIAGSDNSLWPDGGLFDSPDVNHPATGPGLYRLWFDYLEKTDIGHLYVTARDKWGGIRVTGPQYNSKVGNNNGGPITMYGLRCEGHNTNDPSYADILRVEGGIVRYTDGWIGYAMSSPVVDNKPVRPGAAAPITVTGGALVANGLTVDRAATVPETMPMIHASGTSVVRVRDVLVGTKGGVWTGKPRVQRATTPPGSVTTDDSVTVLQV